MRKIITLLFVSLMLVAAGAMAAPLTPDGSLSRALSSRTGSRMRVGMKNPVLCHTEKKASSDEAALYVFSMGEGNGFLVTPADDIALPVLGYSTDGEFDYATAPDNFKWWLSEYAREIEWAVNANVTDTQSAAPQSPSGINMTAIEKGSDNLPQVQPDADWNTIPTLVAARWNQSAPYNNKCPTDAGGRCVTGCVATAYAQVMHYHKWPQGPGTGSHSYNWNGQTLSYNYSATTFDWNNMLNVYTSSANQAQKDAVAELMLACGIGVDMGYGSDSSGAFSLRESYALKEFFGYASNASYLERDIFGDDEWKQMIYNELSKSRPVLYSGSGTNGGHAFVCDGYAGNNYFHFNWGWGGSSDGNFLLSALNPGSLGIGGGAGGFNNNQSITIGVGRPGQVDTPFIYSIFIYEGVSLGSASNRYGTIYDLRLNFGNYLINYSAYDYAGNIGVCLKKDNAVVGYKGSTYLPLNGVTSEGALDGVYYYNCSFNTSDIEPGVYALYPAYNDGINGWGELRVQYGYQQCIYMTVDEDHNATFSNTRPQTGNTLTITEFTPRTQIMPNAETHFDMTCVNGSQNFNGTVTLYAIPETGDDITLGSLNLSVPANTTKQFDITATLNLPVGEYGFYFRDENGVSISTIFNYAVGNLPVTSINLDPTTLTLHVGESQTIQATVLPTTAANRDLQWTSSNTAVADVTNGIVTAVAAGTATITATAADGSGVTATCSVTVLSPVIQVSSITLSPVEKTLTMGEEFDITATVLPSDATDPSLTWKSSNTAVATVSEGHVVSQGQGTAEITAYTKDGSGLSATCYVTVNPATVNVSSITLNPDQAQLSVGGTLTISATVLPEDATNQTLEWSSQDMDVATVIDGVVTAIQPGNTIITAKATDGSEVQATCSITVIENTVPATSIEVTPSNMQAVEGDVFTLTVTVLPENASNKSVTWSTSDSNISTVDNGVVHVLKAGTADITATTADGSNLSAVCHVSVMSGIDEVLASGNLWDVFTPEGKMMKRKADANYIRRLDKGIYIFVSGNRVIKTTIL